MQHQPLEERPCHLTPALNLTHRWSWRSRGRPNCASWRPGWKLTPFPISCGLSSRRICRRAWRPPHCPRRSCSPISSASSCARVHDLAACMSWHRGEMRCWSSLQACVAWWGASASSDGPVLLAASGHPPGISSCSSHPMIFAGPDHHSRSLSSQQETLLLTSDDQTAQQALL